MWSKCTPRMFLRYITCDQNVHQECSSDITCDQNVNQEYSSDITCDQNVNQECSSDITCDQIMFTKNVPQI